MDLTIVSVIFGGILLSAVVFKYVQKESSINITLTCFLTLFGFALVASPAWTQVRWKSKDMEFQLVRETAQQMTDYVRILNGYNEISRSSTDWRADNKETIDFVNLAKELLDQKNRIESALLEGNLEQAIQETKSGTKLIDSIANTIDAS